VRTLCAATGVAFAVIGVAFMTTPFVVACTALHRRRHPGFDISEM
jgi:hypothetical protein